MAPFPLVKLGYLAVKQVSKPIANYIKRKAKSSPFVRQFICIPPAQMYHWMEVNFRLRLIGLGRAKNIEKLPDKEAIELGGDMLGEFLIFTFAALILLSEYQRSAMKEQKKEDKLREAKKRMNDKIEELKIITEIQESQIHELHRRLDKLSSIPERVDNSRKDNDGKGNSVVKRIFGAS